MLRYTTDTARPGLVALYDIRPGNGAGQFLQPRSPHGAVSDVNKTFLSRQRPRPRLWVSRPRPRPPYFFKTKTKTKTF